LFIAVVSFAPDGVAGWLARHWEATRSGALHRLAPAYAMVAPALVAGLIGTVMLIELANHQIAMARSEGSAMKLFGFAVDASEVQPWTAALVLLLGGAAATWFLWPRVDDAWSLVNKGLRARGRA
jgi:branched-chain amino acid transport system permease protein